jgi:hypothetical protein
MGDKSSVHAEGAGSESSILLACLRILRIAEPAM